MDCYRLEDSDEDLGFDEYFQDERALPLLNGVNLFKIYYLRNI